MGGLGADSTEPRGVRGWWPGELRCIQLSALLEGVWPKAGMGVGSQTHGEQRTQTEELGPIWGNKRGVS